MTGIIGKIAETLGLGAEEHKTNAAAAGNGGPTEAGGGAGTGGLSTAGGVGGTPDDLAGGLVAAAATEHKQHEAAPHAPAELRASPAHGLRTHGPKPNHDDAPG